MENVLPYLIRWCLLANAVSGLIAIYIASKTRRDAVHEKILTAVACLIVVHSFHALIVSAFFPGRAFLDWGAPYGLAYGPLLFFAMKAAQVNGPFRRGIYFTHAAPFALYYVLYLTSVCVPSCLDILYPVIRNTLFRAIVLSFFCYGVYSFYLYRKTPLVFKRSVNLLTTASLMILIVGFLMLSVDSSSPRTHASFYIPRLMMYGMMAIVVVVILDHKLRLLIQPEVPEVSAEKDAEVVSETRMYAKSGLSPQALALYEERVTTMVENEKLYLDPALNLERLSELTKIPRHHLSQIFSLQMGRSFTDYVNQLRIQHACEELKQAADVSIEQLGYECGFNSKVSFYRNFKLYTGSTPSQYIFRLKEADQQKAGF